VLLEQDVMVYSPIGTCEVSCRKYEKLLSDRQEVDKQSLKSSHLHAYEVDFNNLYFGMNYSKLADGQTLSIVSVFSFVALQLEILDTYAVAYCKNYLD
jgi:hypothetical protein